MPSSGFFAAPGTDYTRGDEPELARRLGKLGRALKLHLIGLSGYRTPAHSVEVGGFANDPHTQAKASDTPGVEGVSESTLHRFGLTRPFGGASEADHIQLFKGTARNMTKGGRHHLFSIAELWTQAGGPRNLAPTMAAIAMAESGGRVDAVSPQNTDGTYDYGLFQINSSHSQFDVNKLVSDPEYNAKAAVSVWRAQGLTAWSTYSNGSYESFLGSGAKKYAPTFSRTRPGGEGSDTTDTGAGIDTAFASYIAESDGTAGGAENVAWLGVPGLSLPLFNPLDAFKSAKDAVNGTADFLKWIAWIFHPRNVLRMVEFLIGFTLMGFGIVTAIQVNQGAEDTALGKAGRNTKRGVGTAISVTPVGRGARVAKGVRAGKQAQRAAKHRSEFNEARRRGLKDQGRKKMDKKFGKNPPF
jgi:hypothetical protein